MPIKSDEPSRGRTAPLLTFKVTSVTYVPRAFTSANYSLRQNCIFGFRMDVAISRGDLALST